jgi:hypothetical protein
MRSWGKIERKSPKFKAPWGQDMHLKKAEESVHYAGSDTTRHFLPPERSQVMNRVPAIPAILIRCALACLLIKCAGQAQSISLGVKGGISIPQLRGGNSEQTQGYTSRLGPDFGIFASKDLLGSFGVQVELLYASQGGKKTGTQPIPDGSLPTGTVPPGTVLYASYNNETILNYLEVPILARYTMNVSGNTGVLKVYVDAGPYFGILLNAKTETSGTSSIYTDKAGTPLLLPPAGQPIPPVDFTATTDVTGDIKKLNAGITVGVGVATPLGPGELGLDARGSYGLSDIQRDPANGKNNTGSFVITICYAIQV